MYTALWIFVQCIMDIQYVQAGKVSGAEFIAFPPYQEEPKMGLEPTTCSLRMSYSTN